jgi:hypothetical protein
VAVEELDQSVSLKSYSAKFKKDLLKRGMLKILEEGPMKLNDDNAIFMVATYTVEPVVFKKLVYNVVYQKRGYVITCNSVDPDFDRHRAKFEEIAKTFRAEPE